MQHKALAQGVFQHRAFVKERGNHALAPHGLGPYGGGGLELHKFQIHQLRPRLKGHGDPIAAAVRTIGGEGVNAAKPAAAQQHAGR